MECKIKGYLRIKSNASKIDSKIRLGDRLVTPRLS